MDSSTEDRQGRRGRRFGWRRAAGLLVLALAVLVGAAWLWRAILLERVVHLLFADHPIGRVDFSIARVDLDGARIERFAVPGLGIAGEAVEVTYHPRELLRGRARSLRVEGLTGRAEVGPDGLRISGIDPGPGDDGGFALPPVPADRVDLADFRIDLATPQGEVTAGGDLTLLARDGVPARVVLLATLEGEPGRLRAFADLGIDMPAPGRLRAAGPWSLGGDWSGPWGTAAALAGGEAAARLRDGVLESAEIDMTIPGAVVSGLEAFSGTASLAYAPDAVAAEADLAWQGGSAVLAVAPRAEGDARFSLDLDLDAGWLAGRLPVDARATGRVRLAAEGTLPIGVDGLGVEVPGVDRRGAASRLAAGAAIAARLDLALRNLDVPSAGRAAALAGTVAVDLSGGRLIAALEPGFAGSGIVPAPAWIAALPEPAAGLFGDAAGLRVAGGEGQLLRVAARLDRTAPIAATVDLALSGGRLAGRIAATAAALRHDAGFALYAADAALAIDRVETPVGGASGRVSLGNVLFHDGAGRGALAATLRLDRPRFADMRAAEATITLSGEFGLRDDIVTFVPAAPLLVSGASLDLGPVVLPGRLRLALAAEPNRPLRFDIGAGRLEAELSGQPVRLAGTAAGVGRFQADIARLRLSAGADGVAASLAGRLDLPDQAVALVGLDASVAGPAGAERARLRVDRIDRPGPAAAVIPLGMTAEVRRDGRQALFEAELFDSGRRLVLSARGSHRLDTGTGRADLALQPITFLPTVLQPDDLFPVLADRFTEVDGEIAADGALRWGPAALESSGTLKLSARTVATTGAELRDVESTVRFTSLMPPQSAPDQIVTASIVEVGLPFTDGRAAFRLDDGRLVTARLENLSLFGGTIHTEPFRLDIADPDLTVVLRVDGMDLQRFLTFVEYGDVEAEGTLRGRLPVVITRGYAAIHGGVLETEGPGTLRYLPAAAEALQAGGMGTEILFQALQDFHYDSIRIEIDESPGRTQVMQLALKGNSPKVFDGFPLELNVSVSGALRDVLERGLRTYQLPAGVADRLGAGMR
ncbi:MAG: YdbH domain-containing protein [Alphaproteobacteria bacterium]